MHGHIRGDDGATAVEYGLIVFAIAAVIAVAVFAFGRVVADTYDKTCTNIDGQVVNSINCN